jgi:hypothetical protein
VKSFTSRQFREMYARLPANVQLQARRAFRLFIVDPSHPSLKFKKVDEENNIYSARVGLSYRVFGQIDGSEITWFWIGSHGDYDKRV